MTYRSWDGGTRRRTVLLARAVGVAGVLFGVPAVVLVQHQMRPRLSRTIHTQINLGMTGAEVEALIGFPPGDYTDRVPPPNLVYVLNPPDPQGGAWKAWVADETWSRADAATAVELCVSLDHQGRVDRVQAHYFPYVRLTTVEKVRRWFDETRARLGL